MPGLFGLLSGIIGFIVGIFLIIAVLGTWSNTGRIAKASERTAKASERILHALASQLGIDPSTGKKLTAGE